MARTKAEVRAFLNSKVGTIVPHPGIPDLNGQCVTLIKALMEFLGVPNPYAARGHAKDAGDTYIRQGLGTPGKGWLTIVVNRSMGNIGGVTYGHIWVDLAGEANYESNGNRALYTTKNTRPISQGQQFINFDKYIKEEDSNMKLNLATARQLAETVLGREGAMQGKHDADLKKHHVGKEITVQYLNGLYDSTEARSFRARKKKTETAKPHATTVNKGVVVDYINKNLK